MRGKLPGRTRARRLSRSFAHVGVQLPPQRIREVLAGAPAPEPEFFDLNFAFIATQINHEKRVARFKRLRHNGIRSLIFVGLVLVVLNFLVCIAYLLLNLAQQVP
ncbi:hypothetical protein [Mycobacterium spongiae]|uniref:Transmembrane protein n=1 Tax=Mycobacterium spongiae TaxID=886343 RepID=A0A975PZ67_9MYCO|nr:hypothetical protein [Mycobacterium spongiae]QUR69508.1 hypothetical protein F6B93_00975 [Mycobacterium spongiae]